MASDLKFCVDCKHYPMDSAARTEWRECQSPNNTRDLVTGDYIKEFCSIHRSERYEHLGNYCGPSGNWFEPREEENNK